MNQVSPLLNHYFPSTRIIIIGFGRLFQDDDNFIYVKSLSDFLYILKPTRKGREYDLIKTMHFKPEINHYFYEKVIQLFIWPPLMVFIILIEIIFK